MKISDFDYELPSESIAKFPLPKRDESKLLVVKKDGIEHKKFYNIVDYLREGDVVVLNDSKVLNARLIGETDGGRKVEIFLNRKLEQVGVWEAFAKPGKRVGEGEMVYFGDDLFAKILETLDDGTKIIYLSGGIDKINKYGKVPLPPYIKRDAISQDEISYQTIYADKIGSVAAPTAGLHWTDELIKKAEDKGVIFVKITLEVSAGTFQPVKAKDIEDHEMHEEKYIISKKAADIINRAMKENRRIIANGTTSLRALEANIGSDEAVLGNLFAEMFARTAENEERKEYWESEKKKNGKIRSGEFYTDIFIYPPYNFKVVNALITNFHLPKSTLLMLVSAFIGSTERTLEIYEEAKKNGYRFFSYGDAMFIEE